MPKSRVKKSAKGMVLARKRAALKKSAAFKKRRLGTTRDTPSAETGTSVPVGTTTYSRPAGLEVDVWHEDPSPGGEHQHLPAETHAGTHVHWALSEMLTEPGPVREEAVEAFRHLLAQFNDPGDLRRLTAELPRPTDQATQGEQVWGSDPTDLDVAEAEVHQVRLKYERRRALARRSLTTEAAAQLLDVSVQAVTDAVRQGGLLGVKVGRRWHLPLWQFDADAERGYLPGIAEVAAAFPGGVVSMSAWMSRPSPDLDDRPPRDALAANEVANVVEVARTLTAAGW